MSLLGCADVVLELHGVQLDLLSEWHSPSAVGCCATSLSGTDGKASAAVMLCDSFKVHLAVMACAGCVCLSCQPLP